LDEKIQKGLNCIIHLEGNLMISFPFKLTSEQATDLINDFKTPEPFLDLIFDGVPGGVVQKNRVLGIQFK